MKKLKKKKPHINVNEGSVEKTFFMCIGLHTTLIVLKSSCS